MLTCVHDIFLLSIKEIRETQNLKETMMNRELLKFQFKTWYTSGGNVKLSMNSLTDFVHF